MNMGEYFNIGESSLLVRTDEDGNTVSSATKKALVLWREDLDNYIMSEIIKMAQDNGVTDLYVLNKDFILSAIREKLEREGPPMIREEKIKRLKALKARCERLIVSSDRGPEEWREDAEALDLALTALRPVSREQLDVVINSLKLRLENNEENGVVYIPKFAVEEMIKRLEVLRND